MALALLLLGAALLVLGLQSHRHPLGPPTVDRPVAAPAAATGPTPTTVPTVPTAPAVASSVPVALSIPAIDVATPLSALGLNPDGTVQVPTDPQEPGWYHFGPTPGAVGSAVILGHVDSYLGPAVFFRLRALVTGDHVDVRLADGVEAHFVVSTVVTYPKAQFPDQLVYTSHGFSALQLVTCGGTFDARTGHYLSNVVVYTHLSGSTPPTAPATNPPTTPPTTPAPNPPTTPPTTPPTGGA